MSEKRVAKARRTTLGFEDHGLLTAFIELDYGGACQSIPARAFGSRSQGYSEDLARFVAAVLDAFGVDTWEEVKGRTVYAIIGDNGLIRGLEPLPTERGEACDFAEMFDKKAATA